MCHPVQDESIVRKKRGAENPLALLRRHYMNRNSQKSEKMLPRRSRNFQQESSKQVCTSVPEQVCEKKRVNPRIVEKQMVKKFCRKPRKESYFDQLLLAKLSKRDP